LDIRVLLNNDMLLKEEAIEACGKYNKEQLIPIRIEGLQHKVLLTEYNELDKGYFYDPRSGKAFKYDHLRKEVSDVHPMESDMYIEPWRSALESLWITYTQDHYKHGTCSVFGTVQHGDIVLIACIEDHQFQPKNFWNGRWRSIWTITIPSGLGVADINGLVRVQVHYYEDGNVQLVSSKEIKDTITISNEIQMAKEFVQFVKDAENEYQISVSENYQTMSDATFKALRRQLPVTHAKIDWNKMLSYRIGSELKHH
ncbi:F-actin-capping protein subunit alpha-like, partial [Centruroides sculpturatus]|uniref:F-actin-capping protein subunit alpha-like n=1 Tax=Centruroides sculpturatus TaxID=218467 RepID=UPI000C6EF9C7